MFDLARNRARLRPTSTSSNVVTSRAASGHLVLTLPSDLIGSKLHTPGTIMRLRCGLVLTGERYGHLGAGRSPGPDRHGQGLAADHVASETIGIRPLIGQGDLSTSHACTNTE